MNAKKLTITGFLTLLLLAFLFSGQAGAVGVISEHPRLFFTSSGVTSSLTTGNLMARCGIPGNEGNVEAGGSFGSHSDYWNEVKNYANGRLTVDPTTRITVHKIWDLLPLTFAYQMTGNIAYAEKAVQYLNVLDFNGVDRGDVPYMALIYDLIIGYPGWNATQKTAFVNGMNNLLNIHDNNITLPALSAYHDDIQWLAGPGLVALALSGDAGADQTTIDLDLNNISAKLPEMLGGRDEVGYDGGYYLTSPYNVNDELRYVLLYEGWKTATGEDYWTATDSDWTQAKAPGSPAPGVPGSDHFLNKPAWIMLENASQGFGMGQADSYNNVGYLPWAFIHPKYSRNMKHQKILEDMLGSPSSINDYLLVYYIIFHDKSVGTESPGPEDGFRHFRGSGDVFFRNGFDYSATSPDIVVKFQNGPIVGSHDHYDQNNLILYRGNDPLIHEYTYYQGRTGTYYNNYASRTIAHNTLTVRRDDEQFWVSSSVEAEANDGGQATLYAGYYDAGGTWIKSSSFPRKTGDASSTARWFRGNGITAFENADAYAYALGDATGAYWQNKLDVYNRGVVYLKNIDQVFVIDRVKTDDAGYVKKIHWHSITKPALNGSESVTQGSADAGIMLSTDSTVATITKGDSKLYLSVLSPANPKMTKIGGANYEFYADGAQRELISRSKLDTDTMAQWRLEVEPAAASQEDVFIHVLQPGPSSASMVPSVKVQSSSGSMVGALVKHPTENQVVLFSSDVNAASPSLPVTYTVSPTNDTRHLLFDMGAGTDYYVTVVTNNDNTQTITVMDPADAAGGGAVYTSSSKGVLSFPAPFFPPQISSSPTATSITNDSAVIEWTTDRPGTSLLEYYIVADNKSTKRGQYVASGLPAANTLTVGTPLWQANELAGLELRPSTSGNTTFTIVSNTATTIETAAEDGDMRLVPDTGVTFEILRTSHSIQLTGLTGSTAYFVRAFSTDQYGNDGDNFPADNNPSSIVKFFTTAAPDTTPPVITSPPTFTSITDSTATVAWATNEASTSLVHYDTTSGAWEDYSSGVTDPGLSTAHSVTLTGLASGTTYYLRVGSVDAVGNGPTKSSEVSFQTTAAADVNAPQITAPPTVTSITDTTAVVEWTTDEPGTSVVQYGPTSAYGSTRSLGNYVTSHSLTLTGLNSSTLYHFRVSSTDMSGNGPNTSTTDNNPSSDNTFTTQPTPDTTAPQIIATPTATSITENSAVIQWTTDEPGNSEVRYDKVSHLSGATPFLVYVFVETVAGSRTNHLVTLTGLTSGTSYYFRVASTDAAGNGPERTHDDNNPSVEVSFLTTIPDVTAPQITAPPTVTAKTDTTAVIEWTTDEPGNSEVRYGTSSSAWANYSLTRSVAGTVTNHSVTLTGLLSGTSYFFRVGSTDALGNGPNKSTTDNNPSSEVNFVTDPAPDVTAPQITAPPTVTAKTDTTAIIEWSTDEPGNSEVRYGTGSATWTGYPSTRSVAGTVTNHSVTLTGLLSGTSYYFRVGSTDALGNGPNTSTTDNNPSSEVNFVTDPAPDVTAPQITAPPTVAAKTDTTATIEWTTDEPGNSEVRYGTGSATWTGYPSTRSVAGTATNHSVTLTGLLSGTSYYFRVGSTDAAGNGPDKSTTDNNPSGEVNFLTELTPDTTAPQITSPPTVTVKTDTTATIEWSTDEPSNSVVQYGDVSADWDAYVSIKSNADLVTLHTVTLVGLDASSTYYFRVGSTDALGNGPGASATDNNPSGEGSFTTEAEPDTTAPQISDLAVTPGADSNAIVTWTTDEPGNSLVQYDQASKTWGNYSSSANGATLKTTHSMVLTGLTSGTTYYLRVGAVDASGNGPDNHPNTTNPSNEVTFVPVAAADTEAPQISGVQVAAATDTTAIITWSTNEPGNSDVKYDTVSWLSAETPWGHYAFSRTVAGTVTSHSVTLTGLTSGTSYYFQVGSTDLSGNGPDKTAGDPNPSSEMNFLTSGVSDTAAPQISNVQVASKSGTTALITWTTDEPGNTQIQYGESTGAWGSYPSSRSSGTLVISHAITLTGLTPDTDYFFRVGSSDAFGNNPDTDPLDDNPSEPESTFKTDPPPDTDPPSIVAYPTIDTLNDTIDVTFDESFMKNAAVEANYSFSPTLFFASAGADIFSVGGNTYRLFMFSVPKYTILELTVNPSCTTQCITDDSGNLVDPNTIRINDDDHDGMADDWETDNGVADPSLDPDGDGLTNLQEFNGGGTLSTDPNDPDTDNDDLPDGWEIANGLDPLDSDQNSNGVNDGQDDFDNDGWTNYQEYVGGSNPYDPGGGPAVPDIVESIPRNNAGIADGIQVPNDTSFSVRIGSAVGIDTTVASGVSFFISEGGISEYGRDLNAPTVRVTKLTSDPNDQVKGLWVVYDKSQEGAGTTYTFDMIVGVSVYVTDINSNSMSEYFRFKVESYGENIIAAVAERPPTTTTAGGSGTTIEVTSGTLVGALILYDNAETLVPRFGPLSGIPPLDIATGVGAPMNLEPPTVFDKPVTIHIPCPGFVDVSSLSVYYYNGSSWVLACDATGAVQAGGDGWMVPGSRVNHNRSGGEISTIEIQVYHFSGVQAGFSPTPSGGGPGDTGGDGSGGTLPDGIGRLTGGPGGGGGCFVSTLTAN